MKIFNAKERDSVVAGNTEQQEMTMADSATLFYLLSEGLYKDTVLASFREIITNANDAHAENGVTDKIQINQEEGMVTIRDFGGGIPHDKFMSLYGVLGGTTKGDSFVSTGGMGIGKLAPLSMTECFIITNHYDGVSKTYTITRGSVESNGRPLISLLSEVPSNERGGLYVQIPYSVHRTTVITTIQRILLLGNIPAVFKSFGVVNLTVEDLADPIGHIVPHMKGTRVRWGHNTYSINDHKWDLRGYPTIKCIYEEYGSSIAFIINIPLSVPLSITPNRESLIDTPNNKEVIHTYLSKLESLLKKELPRMRSKAVELLLKEATDNPQLGWEYLANRHPYVSGSILDHQLYQGRAYVGITDALANNKIVVNSVNCLPVYRALIPRDYISDVSDKMLLKHMDNRRIKVISAKPITDYSKKARKVLAILAQFGIQKRHIKLPINCYGHVSYYLMITPTVKLVDTGHAQYGVRNKEIIFTCLKKTDKEGLKKALLKQLPHLKFEEEVVVKKAKTVKRAKPVNAHFLSLSDYLANMDDDDCLASHPNRVTPRSFTTIIEPKAINQAVQLLRILYGELTPEQLHEKVIHLLNNKIKGTTEQYTLDSKIGIGSSNSKQKVTALYAGDFTDYIHSVNPVITAVLLQQACFGLPFKYHPLMYTGNSKSIINQFMKFLGGEQYKLKKDEVRILEQLCIADRDNVDFLYFPNHKRSHYPLPDKPLIHGKDMNYHTGLILWKVHTHADLTVFLRIVNNSHVYNTPSYQKVTP